MVRVKALAVLACIVTFNSAYVGYSLISPLKVGQGQKMPLLLYGSKLMARDSKPKYVRLECEILRISLGLPKLAMLQAIRRNIVVYPWDFLSHRRYIHFSMESKD